MLQEVDPLLEQLLDCNILIYLCLYLENNGKQIQRKMVSSSLETAVRSDGSHLILICHFWDMFIGTEYGFRRNCSPAF